MVSSRRVSETDWSVETRSFLLGADELSETAAEPVLLRVVPCLPRTSQERGLPGFAPGCGPHPQTWFLLLVPPPALGTGDAIFICRGVQTKDVVTFF